MRRDGAGGRQRRNRRATSERRLPTIGRTPGTGSSSKPPTYDAANDVAGHASSLATASWVGLVGRGDRLIVAGRAGDFVVEGPRVRKATVQLGPLLGHDRRGCVRDRA